MTNNLQEVYVLFWLYFNFFIKIKKIQKVNFQTPPNKNLVQASQPDYTKAIATSPPTVHARSLGQRIIHEAFFFVFYIGALRSSCPPMKMGRRGFFTIPRPLGWCFVFGYIAVGGVRGRGRWLEQLDFDLAPNRAVGGWYVDLVYIEVYEGKTFSIKFETTNEFAVYSLQ